MCRTLLSTHTGSLQSVLSLGGLRLPSAPCALSFTIRGTSDISRCRSGRIDSEGLGNLKNIPSHVGGRIWNLELCSFVFSPDRT